MKKNDLTEKSLTNVLIAKRELYLLLSLLITGIVYQYRSGMSGNDFWWHVKTGEWIVSHNSIPSVDVFSWFAEENGIKWVSHEWLSDVVLYLLHNLGGNLLVFLLSMIAAIIMAALIIYRNRFQIKNNLLFSILYLFPIISLFPTFFYGRPHLFSFFLLYATLACLYNYRENENSKSIYYVPIIAILWGNFHGGSSNIPYILCFIFLGSGLIDLTVGKIEFSKMPKKQILTYFLTGILSLLVLVINPHGLTMLSYPYTNMADSFMQSFIAEWASPDAKEPFDLFAFFLPVLIVGVSLVITEKRIQIIDLLIFMFFAFMAFRSIRFCIIFFIATSFFAMKYFVSRESKPINTKFEKIIMIIFFIALLAVNVYSVSNIVKTYQDESLITVALDDKFVAFVKEDEPQRLYNDYNFGETLIYHDLKTFVDARADIFSKYNLRDAIGLMDLAETHKTKKDQIFDPEKIINKYDFDAFLIQPNRSLAAYLKSHPEKYQLLMADENAVYFRKIENQNK